MLTPVLGVLNEIVSGNAFIVLASNSRGSTMDPRKQANFFIITQRIDGKARAFTDIANAIAFWGCIVSHMTSFPAATFEPGDWHNLLRKHYHRQPRQQQ